MDNKTEDLFPLLGGVRGGLLLPLASCLLPLASCLLPLGLWQYVHNR
ncbi:hypothetical protein BJP36_40560 [Moorena producens JHB]|uniref:Uncharacterized protein n=1 Tax=Moorena producens (strain JHB) TaxID=1454205 RepID=A0A9Q9SS57_MOOP1|nr:hypothetical protein [Moorena producens]WAN68664.1 hypothetical protein BJP36_40560 [Moorena producens JHB]